MEDSHHTGLVVGRIEVDRSCPLVRTVLMTATRRRNLLGKQRWEEGTAHTFAVGIEVDCSILGYQTYRKVVVEESFQKLFVRVVEKSCGFVCRVKTLLAEGVQKSKE